MSLLSRFRRTVLPSNSRSKKVAAANTTDTDDVRQYNYRKSTKSFNEKSNKPKNSHLYIDTHDDNNHNVAERQSSRKNGNKKLFQSSTLIADNSKKNKTDNSSGAILSRSNTFTLEDESNIQNGTYPRSHKKGKNPNFGRYREVNATDSFDESNANIVNKDVFETFYLKRPSKSSHSSKSSNDSIRGIDDSAPPFTRSNVHLMLKDKDCSYLNKQPSSIRSEKYKPQEYLFGSTFDKKTKDEREIENVYEDYHNNATNNNNNNNNNTNNNRFKTITINHLRRSFRDTFLDSTKPAKGREHQQLWFIDVKDKRNEEMDNVDQQNKNNSNCQPIDDDNKYVGENCRVKRNETFRIDNGPRNNTVSRRDTFRINRDQSPISSFERSPSVESNSSFTTNHHRPNKNVPLNRKMVPVAVTAPYSASNDTDYRSNSSFSQNHHRETKNSEYNRYDDDSDHEGSPPQYLYASKHIRNHSPTRYSKQNNFNMSIGSTPNTQIEINSPEKNRFIQNNANDGQNSFENRSIPGRQSFNNFDTAFERIRGNRSYTSLRNKLEVEQTVPNNRNYDVVDAREQDSDNNSHIPLHSEPIEPWRRISSRQLFDSENRSFVPYRSDYSKYDDPAHKTKNPNRTTININCNYDSNSKRSVKHPNNFQRNEPAHTHTFSIPLTTNKSPSIRKTKPNKNRSVNFPSVECEVRIISPNYDTKPRRKPKPANDWSFNKVYL